MVKRILLCIISLLWIKGALAQQCEILRVGGANSWRPVSYINNQTLEADGIANDVVRMIGTKLGIPVTINLDFPWKRMLHNLTVGDLDINSALYWNKNRAEVYRYTAPYFVNEIRVFVRKGMEFSFDRFEDLIGRTGGVPAGGSFGEKFDSFAQDHQLKLIGIETEKQGIGMLLLGRTDYYLKDYLDGMTYIKNHGLENDIVALAHPISTELVYFALSRQSPCVYLVPRINKIINQVKQDGTLNAIIDKYIKTKIPN